ncbi:MAG TPA: hypothetical protein VL333_13020 [Candidatus Saccharimonadales bacterium]|jgi:hypothetical protein|nr:hypothetical protein [Candidatus Saccharimonadales bacterium]
MATTLTPDPGSSAQIIVQPGNSVAPDKSAVEIASDAARARVAAGQPLVPGAAPAAPVVPAAGQPPRVPAGVPEGGQFAKPGEQAAPPAGQAPAAGEAPKPGEEPAPGAEAAPEGAGEAEADPLRVELPFTPEGAESPLAIVADSPETAAALAQLSEDAVAGREARELVDSAHAQLQRMDEIREYAEVDPIGAFLDLTNRDKETAKQMTLFFLSQPSLFNELKPQLEKLISDPNEIRALAGDVATSRSNLEREAQSRITQGREVKSNLADIQTAVVSMLPAEMSEAARKVAFTDMLRDLQIYADSNNLMTLPVHQVPKLLENRLLALGIDPEVAASAAAVALARRGGSTMTGRPAMAARRAPAAPARPAAPPAPARPKPNGAAFAKAATVRAAGASIPAGGAGSPGAAAPLTAPTNADGTKMTTAQAVQWHRDRLKRGVKTY